MSEIEEIIARAICNADKPQPSKGDAWDLMLDWAQAEATGSAVVWGVVGQVEQYRKFAIAVLAAIEAAGYVVVPKEPTDAMIAAGVTAFMNDAGVLVADRDALFVWRAMVAASRIRTEQEG